MIPQRYFDKVCKHFNGDRVKTWAWFEIPIASLGGRTPFTMLRVNKGKKLMDYIDKMIRGDVR